jgi:hypothetical protein
MTSKSPTDFKSLLKYAASSKVKAAVIVLINEDDSIMAGASETLSRDTTVDLLRESAMLVAGRYANTTIH